MHDLTRPIPVLFSERIVDLLEKDASAQGVDPPQIIGKIVADYYDARLDAGSEHLHAVRPLAASEQNQTTAPFQVARAFPKYPRQSLRLAQLFIDEVVKFPDVEARQRNRSITFFPCFVRIDYVLSNRAPRSGLCVSFYGSANQFNDPRHLLKPGPKSYVRARITSKDELDYCRAFLSRAFENRFGKEA